MLYFITSLKQIRFKKPFFILMILLMTSTIFLVTTFVYIYLTSYNDLKSMRAQFPVRLTLKQNISSNETTESIRVPYELMKKSDYFKYIDSNLFLSGTIDSHLRLPNELGSRDRLEDETYFQGVIQSIREYDNSYLVRVLITKVLWGTLINQESIFKLQTDMPMDEIELLIGKELYLYAKNDGIQYNLSEHFIQTSIPVNEERTELQQIEYYSYMGSLENRKTSQFQYPILYTQNIKTYEPFLNNSYQLVDGEYFTTEQYEAKDSVCLISHDLAKRFDYQVGDTIPITNIGVHVSSSLSNPHLYTCGPFDNDYLSIYMYYLMTGVLDEKQALDLDSPTDSSNYINDLLSRYKLTYKEYLTDTMQEYKIVGIYNNDTYGNDPYYGLNPNTIIMPTNIPMKDSSLDESIFSHYKLNGITYTFHNPDKKDEFYNYLSTNHFNFSTYDITIHDNGYYDIQNILIKIQHTALLLFIISFIVFLFLLILFIYFFMQSSKRTYILSRILGISKLKSRWTIGYVIHIIFLVSCGLTLTFQLLFFPKIIKFFYDNTTKNSKIENITTIMSQSSLTDTINYRWNIRILPYTLLILCIIYFLVYTVLTSKFMNKKLIQLINEK